MDAVPLYRGIAGETFADGRKHWRVVPNLCMTRHAGIGAWQTSKGRLFDGGVTITAIDAVIANVMFVAEGHRLIQRNIDIGRVGRPIDFGGGPTGYANEHDDTEYRYTRVNIRPRRKKLGHENLRFCSATRKSRTKAGWDARNVVSKPRCGGRLMREFEPSQPRRLAIKVFFESDYLKSAAEHFRMEQGL